MKWMSSRAMDQVLGVLFAAFYALWAELKAGLSLVNARPCLKPQSDGLGQKMEQRASRQLEVLKG
jgi:hypothetical protein